MGASQLNNEQVMSSPENPFGAKPSTAAAAIYVQSPPLVEVMCEQLEYLVMHAAQGCTPACLDCARLEQVKNCLLEPFTSKRESLATQ